MAKIYTKVGDQGQTALLGGRKVSKSDDRIWSYGTVDELNAAIGFVRSEIAVTLKSEDTQDSSQILHSLGKLDGSLEQIQHWLFDLGGLLASDSESRKKFSLSEFTQNHILFLESRIDEMTGVIPPLREFVLPGGHEIASRLHLARTICRRAERHIVALNDLELSNTIPFINRLSDYLFTSARFSNHLLSISDVTWKKT